MTPEFDHVGVLPHWITRAIKNNIDIACLEIYSGREAAKWHENAFGMF
jgi:hypothetical protein